MSSSHPAGRCAAPLSIRAARACKVVWSARRPVGLTAQYVGRRVVQVDLLMDDEGTALDQAGDRDGRHSSTLVQVSEAHAPKPKHTEAQPQATHPGCHLFYLSTDRLQLLPVCSPAGYLEGTCCGHTPKCDA